MIGLFGGSFDPPHLGHRALVQAALHALPLQEVWVVPVGIPVHRVLHARIPADVRMSWVRALFADMSQVRVRDWEIARAEPTPTIWTLRRARRELGGACPLLLLGMDAWAGMESWIAYPEHRQHCHVAVFARAGVAPVSLTGWKPLSSASLTAADSPSCGGVISVACDLPNVSATALRHLLQRDAPMSQWVDKVARAYARQLPWYYGPGVGSNRYFEENA